MFISKWGHRCHKEANQCSCTDEIMLQGLCMNQKINPDKSLIWLDSSFKLPQLAELSLSLHFLLFTILLFIYWSGFWSHPWLGILERTLDSCNIFQVCLCDLNRIRQPCSTLDPALLKTLIYSLRRGTWGRGTWGTSWGICWVDCFQPEGRGFNSRSSRHVETLGKSLTHSCLWRFGVKIRHSIRAVSGALLSRSGLEEAL